MRKTILLIQFIAFIFFPDYLLGQKQDTPITYSFDIVEGDTIYFNADTLASFPSGENGLRKHIAMEFKNPYSKEDNYDYVFDDYNYYCGLAFVRFIVNKTGGVQNTSIVRSKAEKYEKECLRVVNTFKKFKPAMINGQPVNSWYTVSFKLHID